MITVFIVDDHAVVVEGIYALLQSQADIKVVGFSYNAGNCMAYFEKATADVILMDISLPDTIGTELCSFIKSKYPGVMVLALSTFNQGSYIQKMISNGASGYLLKNACKDEIIKAVKAVASGKEYFSFDVSTTLKALNTEDSHFPTLTKREKEVLAHIISGLTNVQIADMLFISIDTVDSHRKNLYSKLKVKNTAQLIKYANERKILE